ncbi:MAG: Vancomycin B-type resistance protein VanW [Acidimicrobiia bacterium]|nr:Vancomycin B-type resistance protein VanW [Acidimicrobiia bacterium]
MVCGPGGSGLRTARKKVELGQLPPRCRYLVKELSLVSSAGSRLIALYGVGIVMAVWVTGLLVTLAAERDHAPPHAEVAGVEVGGLSRSGVRAEVAKLATELSSAVVKIDTGTTAARASATELGLSVQIDATVAAVMHAGRGISPVGWPVTAFQTHKVPVSLAVNADRLANGLAALEEANGRETVEPTLGIKDGLLVAEAGQSGETLDPADVVAAVQTAGYQRGVIEITVQRRPRPPRHPLAEVQALASAANDLTARGLAVQTGAVSTRLTAQQLRSWLRADVAGPKLQLGIDRARTTYELSQLLAAGQQNPVNARLEVRNDVPVVIPGADGSRCCDPAAPDVILKAITDRAAGAALPTIAAPPLITTAFVEHLGVKQKVSEFTTHHLPGQSRVINIHLIADLMRGVVIPPNGTLSINGQIGPRTAEKGFVDAPVIANAFDDHDIGGGVSQFATTLFNAAFFAGLDLTAYQSHSLYISRYPFGREATMGFPSPDLKIHNPTPFGILVWTSYTSTSLTISLYSSPYVANVQQGAQTGRLAGQSCVDVTTQRLITFVDGQTKTDTVRAEYQAMEGLKCNDPLPPGVKLQAIPGQPPVPLPKSAGTGVVPVRPPPTPG